MTVLSKINTIAASGAAQALAGDDTTGTDKVYDITLTGACALSFATGGATGRLQTITAILRQDATAGRVVTLPAGILWPNGSPPSLNTAAGYIDILQFCSVDGVNWIGAALTLKAIAPSLAVTGVGNAYTGQSATVSGAYIGPAPGNIDYALDGGPWTTLAVGVATITNGTISFPLTMPAAGAHTLAIRNTNSTTVGSPAYSFAVNAAAKPSSLTFGASAGNAQNVLTMGGTINGAAVTSISIYRGAAAGGESATAIATLTGSQITNGSTTFNTTYTDTSLTNGTAEYYTFTATNSAGSTTSGEVSATPSSATPNHYFNQTAVNGNGPVSTTPTAANDTSSGYLDMSVQINVNTWQTSKGFSILQRYQYTSSTSSNSAFSLFLQANGVPGMFVYGSGGTFKAFAGTVALSLLGWSYVRVILNRTAAAITSALSIGGSNFTAPSGTMTIFTSSDGATWTQVDQATGIGTDGLKANGTAGVGPSVGCANANSWTPTSTLEFGKIVVQDNSKVLWSPDFTAQATGVTSFSDTAPTANTFTLAGGGSIT